MSGKLELEMIRPLDRCTDELISSYTRVSSARPEVLFREFLPRGYRYTTLDSVPTSALEAAIFAKIHLGMMITLYDDLADHPGYRNPLLLEQLYRLNVDQDVEPEVGLSDSELATFGLARHLFEQLTSILETFPSYRVLLPVLRFDIEQFYACNRYSEMISKVPAVRTLQESQSLGPHNMGIVAAGTIDLMTQERLKLPELARAREVFQMGQRLGRIGNLLFTFDREVAEGDVTNEISIALASGFGSAEEYRQVLLSELGTLRLRIRAQKLAIFDTSRYADGLVKLHQLHDGLKDQI